MRLVMAVLGFGLFADAFSWAPRIKGGDFQEDNYDRVNYSPPQSRLPNVYAIALTELRELESEPLCHRNAARLLVNHCQLLDGKDEATVLTDSGRLARDFVDSYAASLAICDLERGSFRIPSACSKFRESILSAIPILSKPELHVSTAEIDRCLEGLAQSDSAWNTWITYRHKALRFCEAARADNEKDEHIRLYQRVTKILSRLTLEVETHLEARLKSLDEVFEKTSSSLEGMGPRIGTLNRGLEKAEEVVSTRLFNAAETSREVINQASTEAQSLQDLLTAMVQEMRQKTDEMATYYESSLQAFTTRAKDEADAIATTLAVAVSSSAFLRNELENTHARAEEIAYRQERVKLGMNQLEIYVDAMSSTYSEHDEKLKEVQRRADQILGTLDSAASFQSSTSGALGFKGWWPYIYCPVASLVMGSYGLPPSATRNIALVALGEVAGYLVSNLADCISMFLPEGRRTDAVGMEPNTTSFHKSFQPDTDFITVQNLRTSSNTSSF